MCIWTHAARIARPNKDASAVTSTRQNTAPDTSNLHATNTPMHCRIIPQRDSAHIQSPLHTYSTIGFFLQLGSRPASHPKTRQKQSAIQQLAIRPTRSAPSTAFVRSYFAQRPEVGGPVSVPTCGTKGKRFRCWGEPEAAAARPGLTLIM